MVFCNVVKKNSRTCKMDDTLTLSNYYLFSAVKLDYKIAEHPLRIFEEMAIIEQAVNNQMYDKNQEQQIRKYKCMVS